jgi:hypothetical protein
MVSDVCIAFCKQPNVERGIRHSRLHSNLIKSGEDLLDDLVAEDLKDASTVEFISFDGSRGFETSDPVNLQAMLATQFADFGVGYRRYK